MGNEYAGGIYVIEAAKDGKTEYWAAAVPREQAVEVVRQQAPPGWSLRLTERRLPVATVAGLKMRLNSVRQLKSPP